MAHTFHGTLRPCPYNPRYFTDDTGEAIYLSGSHTWATFGNMVPLWGEPEKERSASCSGAGSTLCRITGGNRCGQL